MQPTGIDAFEDIAATLGSPMVIVTARAGDERAGCLVGFSTQCSIDPTRYLVCLSKTNHTYRVARDAASLVVHVLHDAADDRALARLFGENTADEVDKFSRCEWEAGPDGVPVLPTCDWFSGRIVNRTDLGDHVGFIIEPVVGSATRTDEDHLGFAEVRHLDAGKPA
jgi:flavin reductase (DIM6/NTAB) family NADH-FMN oxidoreductase RutF